jgi:hypothetical protein
VGPQLKNQYLNTALQHLDDIAVLQREKNPCDNWLDSREA